MEVFHICSTTIYTGETIYSTIYKYTMKYTKIFSLAKMTKKHEFILLALYISFIHRPHIYIDIDTSFI